MFKRKKEVYCRGCAHLFMIPGGSPKCIAGAEFIGGPLRRKVDVMGIVSAERKNLYNDCLAYTWISFRAWAIKKWVLERMGNGEKIREGKLADYPVKDEFYKASRFKNPEKPRKKTRKKDGESEREGGNGPEREIVFANGGDFGSDSGYPADSVGDEELFDADDDA